MSYERLLFYHVITGTELKMKNRRKKTEKKRSIRIEMP